MRKVTHLVPIEVILPERYDIHLSLNGELSQLSVHEYYPNDTPAEVISNTTKTVMKNRNGVKVSVTKVADRELLLEFTGSEADVINALDGEVNLLRKWAAPLKPVPLITSL